MTIKTSNDPHRATPGDERRRPAPLDAELQADPEIAEGPAGGSRIAIYAVAIVALLGAVFYGLNTNSGTTTATNPAATTTASDSRPAVPPNIRDVTPNRETGTTTGAAPAQPTAPQSGPTGTQVDPSKMPSKQ